MTSEGFSLDDGEFEVDRDDSDLFGAPPDDEPPLTEDEEELLAASKQGRLDKVKALVNRGCRVNQRSPADETPLILAAKHGKKAVVQFLVASTNCDINAVDRVRIPQRFRATAVLTSG